MTVSDDDIASMLDDELLQRRTQVMFLRNLGTPWPTVSKIVGVSAATCRKDYRVVCRDINNEQPADVIARHRAVIFDIQRANYPKMMNGDKDAAMVILRAIDRESKLLGLDQPVKLLASISNEEFAAEAARLIERINALDPATMKELERARHRESQTIIDVTEASLAEPQTVESGRPAPPEGQSAHPVGPVADQRVAGDGGQLRDPGGAEQVHRLNLPEHPADPIGEAEGVPVQPADPEAVLGPGDTSAGGSRGEGTSGDARAGDEDDDWSNI